eukprot:CAMPEP_0198270332 /NCGR_PEP_ID=MMETSP1447-20131203/44652_1 /TAXON_ID=420782 /ORGANISM="Chaetoceros dichaeta, Strain CCMP1751" /LENGTH=149 /DNA_ID=CAMNT_0043962307 /DNA_START=48 /DNA_END=497 /DNA_ORIENTATION=-
MPASQHNQKNAQRINKGNANSPDSKHTENVLPKLRSDLMQQPVQIPASKSPSTSSFMQSNAVTVTPKSSRGDGMDSGQTFDDVLSAFHEDLIESSDIKNGGDNELIDLRVKLCVSENIGLRLHVAFDDILEDIDVILDEAQKASQSFHD